MRTLSTLGLPLAAALGAAALALRSDLAALGPAALTAFIEGPTVALVWAAALGWGCLFERAFKLRGPGTWTPSPAAPAAPWILRAGLGMAALMTIVHLAGLAGLVHPAFYALLGAAGLAGLLTHASPRDPALRAAFTPTLALLAAPAAILFLAASAAPGHLWPGEAAGYDALEYHLQVPREWLAAGRVTALPHNVYSFLPLNLELLSLPLMSLRGGAFDAMLAVQWLHASFAVATAAILGAWAGARAGALAGWTAALAVLALPWTLIAGSLAYNEGATAFFIAAAFFTMWEGRHSKRLLALAGVLVGAAAGTKLTAAGFGAAPLLAALALRPADEGARPPKLALAAAIFAGGALASFFPYLIRNAAWTGNPVFPLATRALGRAHWDDVSEWRWIRAHRSDAGPGRRLAAFANAAVVDGRFGFAVWILAVGGFGLCLSRRDHRSFGLAAAAFATVQAAFWLSATHLQPRFLHPLIVPLALLVGHNFGLFAQRLRPRDLWGLVVVLSVAAGARHALALGRDGRPGLREAIADPWLHSAHLEGDTLRGQKPLLVAEARAFYYPDGTLYATPFEVSLFARLWREKQGAASEVLAALRAKGVTLVIVNWAEAARLKETYGLDAEITPANLEKLQRAGARRLAGSTADLELLQTGP
jgi:hypothetical protein